MLKFPKCIIIKYFTSVTILWKFPIAALPPSLYCQRVYIYIVHYSHTATKLKIVFHQLDKQRNAQAGLPPTHAIQRTSRLSLVFWNAYGVCQTSYWWANKRNCAYKYPNQTNHIINRNPFQCWNDQSIICYIYCLTMMMMCIFFLCGKTPKGKSIERKWLNGKVEGEICLIMLWCMLYYKLRCLFKCGFIRVAQ